MRRLLQNLQQPLNMEVLFDVKYFTISEHINNIFKEGELDENISVGISDKSTGSRKSKIYNLGVIIFA